MSVGYSNRKWACPFLRWDEKLKVHCEGGGVSLPDRETFSGYVERFCACPDGWRACSIAAALLQYHEKETE